jgi:hypothetical protein
MFLHLLFLNFTISHLIAFAMSAEFILPNYVVSKSSTASFVLWF